MTTVYIGLAAFVYVAVIAGICRLMRFSDHDDNLDDEGGWK